MKDAMEDVKSEIMKETDNPVSEIKREIEKSKKQLKNTILPRKIKQELDLRKQIEGKSSDELIQESKEEINKLSDEYQRLPPFQDNGRNYFRRQTNHDFPK